jgi:hypothetical protein
VTASKFRNDNLRGLKNWFECPVTPNRVIGLVAAGPPKWNLLSFSAGFRYRCSFTTVFRPIPSKPAVSAALSSAQRAAATISPH